MRPEGRDAAYLWDMLEAAREVVEMTRTVSTEAFTDNRMLVRATERTLEILGETAKGVSAEVAGEHPEIHWREIVGQRNILAHEYGQIDYNLLYQTATVDVPPLVKLLEGNPFANARGTLSGVTARCASHDLYARKGDISPLSNLDLSSSVSY